MFCAMFVTSLGPMFSLFPHPLYREVAQLTIWGQCSHCFHIHCIMKWLNSQQVHHQCPMCRQEWKFKE
uniref:Anaphase-promoting complex subunit 11 n=1 Tax=Timema genevievae TaxID=629358 RepID=A0A7R9PJH0_TIMGE|nr:unnamed protein product [Timema genevievae]